MKLKKTNRLAQRSRRSRTGNKRSKSRVRHRRSRMRRRRTRQTGKIVIWKSTQGYGYIEKSDNTRIMFSQKDVRFENISEGKDVTFIEMNTYHEEVRAIRVVEITNPPPLDEEFGPLPKEWGDIESSGQGASAASRQPSEVGKFFGGFSQNSGQRRSGGGRMKIRRRSIKVRQKVPETCSAEIAKGVMDKFLYQNESPDFILLTPGTSGAYFDVLFVKVNFERGVIVVRDIHVQINSRTNAGGQWYTNLHGRGGNVIRKGAECNNGGYENIPSYIGKRLLSMPNDYCIVYRTYNDLLQDRRLGLCKGRRGGILRKIVQFLKTGSPKSPWN